VPPFDPISTPTLRIAAHREPAFAFPEQAESARSKLAALEARTGRKPNVLVILFDDVGWGDFYLDPKETHSYMTRKLAYLEVLREGMRAHLATFQAYPPKRVMGLRAPAAGPAQPPA
jgi:hypothetical protein